MNGRLLKWRWVVAGTITVGIVGTIAWRNLTKMSEENDPIAYSMRLAAPLYASLPSVEFSSRGEATGFESFAAELKPALASAEVVGASPAQGGWRVELPGGLAARMPRGAPWVSDAMHAALIDQAVGIFALRMNRQDPGPYLVHRAAHGALLDRARYEHHYPGSFEHSARLIMGDAYTGAESPETLFLATYADNLPTRIAIGDGLAIAYGVASRDFTDADLSGAALGYTGWSGGLSSTYGPMTTGDRTLREIVGAHGPVPLALVGAVVYYDDGRPPRPLCLRFVWSPRKSGWVLDRIVITNISEREASSHAAPSF